jgi:hypothetical protein
MIPEMPPKIEINIRTQVNKIMNQKMDAIMSQKVTSKTLRRACPLLGR